MGMRLGTSPGFSTVMHHVIKEPGNEANLLHLVNRLHTDSLSGSFEVRERD